MAETPKDFKGAIVVSGRLTANPGKADSAAQILAKLKTRADSDAEPGTLQYEIVRYGDEFAVWEKYADSAAVEAHKSELLDELQQSGFFELPKDKGFFFPADSLPPPDA